MKRRVRRRTSSSSGGRVKSMAILSGASVEHDPLRKLVSSSNQPGPAFQHHEQKDDGRKKSGALLDCVGGALADRRTKLAQRNRVEGELEHDVGKAQREEHAEAIGVVIE